jgi:hypothetical protein
MVAVHLPFPGVVPEPPDTMLGLTSPADVLRKFGWEIRELTSRRGDLNENPYEARLNGYRVFNCAVTGWHIAPWTWNCSDGALRAEIAARYRFSLVHQNRRNLERFCQAVAAECRELYICRRIANGNHVIVERSDACVTAHLNGRGSESASYDLKLDAGGMSRDAEDVFHAAFSYWQRVLTELRFLKRPELCDDEADGVAR